MFDVFWPLLDPVFELAAFVKIIHLRMCPHESISYFGESPSFQNAFIYMKKGIGTTPKNGSNRARNTATSLGDLLDVLVVLIYLLVFGVFNYSKMVN